MSRAERILLRRIRRRAASLQPEVARRLLEAYDVIRSTLTERQLLDLLRTGALDRMISDVMADSDVDVALARVRRVIDVRTIEAAEAWSQTLPKSLVGVFNRLDPRVIEAVRRLDRTATSRIDADIREAMRSAAEEGLRMGRGPRAVARTMREYVGLSGRHAAAVGRFRAELEAGDRSALARVLGKGHIRTPGGTTIVRSGHAGGHGLGPRDLGILRRDLGTKALRPDQIERMVEQYRRRLLALNTEAHARSIALDAQRLAQRMSWEDAVRQGFVERRLLRRTWIAVGGPEGDGRNRPEHLELHGTTVGFDEPYPNDQLVPGETDWNCRCIERITLATSAARLAA